MDLQVCLRATASYATLLNFALFLCKILNFASKLIW